MAKLKTTKTGQSVSAFIAALPDEQQRTDCRALVKVMRRAVGAPPRMWGPAIIGFGDYHYRYASGREGDWFIAGFAPRKSGLALYVMPGLDAYPGPVARLGKFKHGKSCINVKRLADIDPTALEDLVRAAVARLGKSPA